MQGTFDMEFRGQKAEIKKLLDYLATTEYAYLFENPVKWGIVPNDFDKLPDDAEAWMRDDPGSSGNITGIYDLCEECMKRFPALELNYCEEYLDYPGKTRYFSMPGSTKLELDMDIEHFSPSSNDVFYFDEFKGELYIPEGETELLEYSKSWEDMENEGPTEYCWCSVTIPKNMKKIGGLAFGCFTLTEVTILSATVELDEKAFYRGQDEQEEVGTLVIHAPAGSTAEAYVKKHGKKYGLEFQAL